MSDSDNKIHKVDTVPPPAGGSAYDEATVIREAPQEVLDAIKKAREQARLNAPPQPPSDSVIPAATAKTPLRPSAMTSDAPNAMDATVIGEMAKLPAKSLPPEEAQKAKSLSPKARSEAPPASRSPRSDAPRASAAVVAPSPVNPSFIATLIVAIVLIVVFALMIDRLAS